jgi:hypothetical protein
MAVAKGIPLEPQDQLVLAPASPEPESYEKAPCQEVNFAKLLIYL